MEIMGSYLWLMEIMAYGIYGWNYGLWQSKMETGLALEIGHMVYTETITQILYKCIWAIVLSMQYMLLYQLKIQNSEQFK